MKLKTAKELGITPTQRRNLARLCLFVNDNVPPPKFEIKTWFTNSAGAQSPPTQAKYECGSSACFLGIAPLAGIKPKVGETWPGYSRRAFSAFEYDGGDICRRYDFLFSPHHENSKEAAVRRGAWFLCHGLPETDEGDLTDWEAPKSFRPPWKLIKAAANA